MGMKARASKASLARVSFESAVQIGGPTEACWFIPPTSLSAAMLKQWVQSTGGTDLPFNYDLVSLARRTAKEVCEDRWTWHEAISGPTQPVLVLIALLETRLSAKERELAWQDLQEWSGVRIKTCESGPDWDAVSGEYGLGYDEGLFAHELRYYSDLGVVLYTVAENEDSLRAILDTVQVTERRQPNKRKRKAGTQNTSKRAVQKQSFKSMLAPEKKVTRLAAYPGPATKEIQRFAASLENVNIQFEVEFKDGEGLSAEIYSGGNDPEWLLMFGADSPYTGGLEDFLPTMAKGLQGREIKSIGITLKRPRGDKALTTEVKNRFREALSEIAGLHRRPSAGRG